MRLEKTGEVVKVDPEYIVSLHKFLMDFVKWEPDEYLKAVGREDVRWRPVNGPAVEYLDYKAVIRPKFLLFPVYRYSSIPKYTVADELGIEFEKDERIKLENLSLFDVYRVVDGVDPEVEITISNEILPEITPSNKKRARLFDITIDFKIGSKKDYYCVIIIWSIWYSNYLKTLRWARGRKYLNFASKGLVHSKVVSHIYAIENGMFVFLNFLYALYNEHFEEDTVESRLFKPLSDLLRSYGNTFEEAMSTINELIVLTGSI
jgi:hypothetical protein